MAEKMERARRKVNDVKRMKWGKWGTIAQVFIRDGVTL
jgi:hypothetical protein